MSEHIGRYDPKPWHFSNSLVGDRTHNGPPEDCAWCKSASRIHDSAALMQAVLILHQYGEVEAAKVRLDSNQQPHG